MNRLEEAVSKVEANDAAQDAQIALNAAQLAEKDAIIAQLRNDATGALSVEGQHALAERLERLLGPVGGEESEPETPKTEGESTPATETELVNPVGDEVVVEPVVENGEVVGGIVHSDPVGEGDANA